MIVEFHKDNAKNYKFEDDAEQVLKNERDDFSGDINDAISDGETPPPKSKKIRPPSLIGCSATRANQHNGMCFGRTQTN